MSLVVPNEGKRFLLNMLLKRNVSSADVFIIGLFRNLLVPVRTTVLSDVVEANFAGYTPRMLTRSLWSESSLIDNKAQSNWGSEFIQWYATSGSQLLYGYYVRDADSNFLLWAQNFSGPKTVTDQDPILIQPSLQATSIFDPS